MVKDVPPFGGYDDPDIGRALNWFLGFANHTERRARFADIENAIEAIMEPRSSRQEAQDHEPITVETDRIGWYLYLADKALHSPLGYEPTQGSRVLPIFKRIGRDLELLATIGGVDDRVKRMLTSERDRPDSALFELLIALLWKRNGFDTVSFIPEKPSEKTADFFAVKEGEQWFVECKRLRKSSQYSEQERTKWLSMWVQFRDVLLETSYSAVFEIVFHVELETLPDDFLVSQLAGKLPLVELPCHIISDDVWDVYARGVDYDIANAHVERYMVRHPSTQLNELIV